jgi:hypothetical protein
MTKTAREWEKRVARWRASGETAEAFGAREGVAANTLRWWASQLRRSRPAPKPFAMVQLVRAPVPAPPAGRGVSIDFAEGRARITVEPGVDAATLRTVLDAFGVRGAA